MELSYIPVFSEQTLPTHHDLVTLTNHKPEEGKINNYSNKGMHLLKTRCASADVITAFCMCQFMS